MDPRLAGRAPRSHPGPADDQQMQSAKITLLSSLLKPDPKATKLTPNIINEFQPLLLSIAANSLPNSPEFVKCVARIVTYIAPSRKRTSALGEHLIKLATSFQQSARDESQASLASLNFLQLLGASFVCIMAVVSEADSHEHGNPAALFTSKISSYATKLMNMAAPRTGLGATPIHKQIHSLLTKWNDAHIFTSSLRIKLYDVARTSYDAWLTWLKSSHHSLYQKLERPSEGPHTHLLSSKVSSDDEWYNTPVSCMIPHIMGQGFIKIADLKSQSTADQPIDPEMELIVAQHIKEIANIFAGQSVARFSSEDEVTLNGLGQPVSINPATGGRKRKYPAYYGMMQNCAKSFKKAREELPALVPVVDTASYAARDFPPPMDDEPQGYSGSSYPPSQPRGGFNAPYGGGRDGNAGGYGYQGAGNSYGGDRGRGYGGRGGGGGGGRGRGRGGWGGGGGGGGGGWN